VVSRTFDLAEATTNLVVSCEPKQVAVGAGYQNLPDGVVATSTYPDLKDPSAWNVTLTGVVKGGTVVLYVVCIS
jgi:hypothetical protein